jgi:hypothetical protein
MKLVLKQKSHTETSVEMEEDLLARILVACGAVQNTPGI